MAIDHSPIAYIAVLRDGGVVDCREDDPDDHPQGSRTFGYPICDGRRVRYSSFDVQDLPLEAPGGWRLELRDAFTDRCALYLHGPQGTVRLIDLGAGWEDTFIGGFSPCGRYLAVRDIGMVRLMARVASFEPPPDAGAPLG